MRGRRRAGRARLGYAGGWGEWGAGESFLAVSRPAHRWGRPPAARLVTASTQLPLVPLPGASTPLPPLFRSSGSPSGLRFQTLFSVSFSSSSSRCLTSCAAPKFPKVSAPRGPGLAPGGPGSSGPVSQWVNQRASIFSLLFWKMLKHRQQQRAERNESLKTQLRQSSAHGRSRFTCCCLHLPPLPALGGQHLKLMINLVERRYRLSPLKLLFGLSYQLI